MEYFKSGVVRLAGDLEGPESKSIVVLGHGFSSSRDNSTNAALCPLLHKAGIPTFRFDFFAHGDSEGDFAEVTPTLTLQNTLDAIAHVRRKGYERIAYFGGSLGGYVGYFVASQEELCALCVKCPVADFGSVTRDLVEDDLETWREKGHSHYFSHSQQKRIKINYTFASEGIENPAYPVMVNIKVPTLIIHGGADTVVPVEQSKRAATLIPHCLLAVVDGAGHEFQAETFDKMIQLAAAFLTEKVRE